MAPIRIGIVGAGFAADFHVRTLRRMQAIDARVVAVSARSRDRARAFADRHGIEHALGTTEELLASDVDLVIVAVPNALHEEATIAAVEAGKHVVVEKPLTGAFGPRRDTGVSRAEQEWALARASVARIDAAVRRAGVRLMYAENWVYAPAVTKVTELLAASGGAILDLRAEQSHSGSHAAASRRRETAGGGALMTLGAHPIAAVLHLKAVESALRGGSPIRPTAVTAEVAALHAVARPSGRAGLLVADWEDVETWAHVVLGFSDGSRASVTASFQMLGGVRNQLEVYTTDAAFRAKIAPNDELLAFTPHADAFGEQALHEKIESRTGWMAIAPDADWARGYPQQMQDFLEAVAHDRDPVSGLALARDTLDVIYGAYLGTARGERIDLAAPPAVGAPVMSGAAS